MYLIKLWLKTSQTQRHPGTGSTEGPKHDEPKETHNQTYMKTRNHRIPRRKHRTLFDINWKFSGGSFSEDWLIGKDSDAEKYWGQEDKGATENEMVRWHHWLNGQEFEQILGDSEGQGSLVCCSPRGRKESDTTEWLNNSNNWREREKKAKINKWDPIKL